MKFKIKTNYATQGAYGSTESRTLYCIHYDDRVEFYDTDGEPMTMVFDEWETGNDLWDAMNRLYFPFENNKLKPGIEYCK